MLLSGTASNMLRQSMVMETRKLETRKQETQEEQFETVAVLDMPKIKEVLCGGDDVEAGYLLQVIYFFINMLINVHINMLINMINAYRH